MSTIHEPPFGSVLTGSGEPYRWKRPVILFGVLAGAALLAMLALWHAFFVYVKPGTHVIVIAKRGAPLPPNQVLAEEGQEGIQRKVLGEGWHFVWPIMYETEHHPNTVIPAGKVGIITAKGGDP